MIYIISQIIKKHNRQNLNSAETNIVFLPSQQSTNIVENNICIIRIICIQNTDNIIWIYWIKNVRRNLIWTVFRCCAVVVPYLLKTKNGWMIEPLTYVTYVICFIYVYEWIHISNTVILNPTDSLQPNY